MSKRFAYVATHSWRSPIRVGSHHYASAISRFGEVLYMSHPISLASLLTRDDNQKALRNALLRDGVSSVADQRGINELTWFMPFAPGGAGIRGSRMFASYGAQICFPNPRRLLEKLDFREVDVLWLDSFFQPYWLDVVDYKKLVVRVADHPAHIANLSSTMTRLFEACLARAELIVTPTPATADYLKGITASPVRVVPNGVDVSHFETAHHRPQEYVAGHGLNVVFVGALASWIDFELIAATALRKPEYTFWLIGPNHQRSLPQMPVNVKFLGSKTYEEIPAYLRHADAAIAPFDVKGQAEFIDSIDAIKLYEYVAAGVPTVATRWRQSESLAPFVLATEQSPAAFSQALDSVTKNPTDHRAPASYKAELSWERRLSFLETVC